MSNIYIGNKQAFNTEQYQSITTFGNSLIDNPHHDILFTNTIAPSYIDTVQACLYGHRALVSKCTDYANMATEKDPQHRQYYTGIVNEGEYSASNITSTANSCLWNHYILDENLQCGAAIIPRMLDLPGFYDDGIAITKDHYTYSDLWRKVVSSDILSVVNDRPMISNAPTTGLGSSRTEAEMQLFSIGSKYYYSLYRTLHLIPKSGWPEFQHPTVSENSTQIAGSPGSIDTSYTQGGRYNHQNVTGSMDFILPEDELYNYKGRDMNSSDENYESNLTYKYHSSYQTIRLIRSLFPGGYKLCMMEDTPGWWMYGRWWVSNAQRANYGYDITLSYNIYPYMVCLHVPGTKIIPPSYGEFPYNVLDGGNTDETRTVGFSESAGIRGTLANGSVVPDYNNSKYIKKDPSYSTVTLNELWGDNVPTAFSIFYKGLDSIKLVTESGVANTYSTSSEYMCPNEADKSGGDTSYSTLGNIVYDPQLVMSSGVTANISSYENSAIGWRVFCYPKRMV